jgi:hypothetical protein
VSAPTHEAQADALEGALGDDDRALLDAVADGLARRRLGTVAILFLESAKPLGFVASQIMFFVQPIFGGLAGDARGYERLARLLERRGAVELLIRRLEARA